MNTLFKIITLIRNGHLDNQKYISYPISITLNSTNVKSETAFNKIFVILKILRNLGFIRGFKYNALPKNKAKTQIIIFLKYDSNINMCIQSISFVSKESFPIYVNNRGITQMGLGASSIFILYTSQGIMTDVEARRLLIGGKVLLSIN